MQRRAYNMKVNALEEMQVWVDALLLVPVLNSELRHRIMWDVVYRRGTAAMN